MVELDGSVNSLIAGAIGAMIAGSFSVLKKKKLLKRNILMLDRMNLEIDRSLDAAERALKNPASPEIVRATILFLLKGLENPALGRLLNTSLKDDSIEPTGDGSLYNAIMELRASHPSLADDIENALFGLANLAIPCKYAGYDTPDVIAHNSTAPSRRYKTIYGAITRPLNGAVQGISGPVPA